MQAALEAEQGHTCCEPCRTCLLRQRNLLPFAGTSPCLPAVKYVKYGRSQVMGDDRAGFWASTTQLAYGAPRGGGQ